MGTISISQNKLFLNTIQALFNAMTTKPTHGGDRQGSGRPNKYGEPTVKKNYRIPVSKIAEVEALLDSYKKPGK